jgi:hypothetical protein
MRHRGVLGFMGAVALLVAGCSEDRGDSDLAGALTGPAVEIHCMGEQRQLDLERTPGGRAVGPTTVTTTCQGPDGTVSATNRTRQGSSVSTTTTSTTSTSTVPTATGVRTHK